MTSWWAVFLGLGLTVAGAGFAVDPPYARVGLALVAIVCAATTVRYVRGTRGWVTIVGSAGAILVMLASAVCIATSGGGTTPERGPADRALAHLEARGFEDATVVAIRGGTVELDARKDGERCAVQIRFAGDEARMAVRCAGPDEEAERACDEGQADRCADAAQAVRERSPVDWPRATALSVRACEGGFERECFHVGLAHAAMDRGVPHDDGAALRMFERACAAGSHPACARLGRSPVAGSP